MEVKITFLFLIIGIVNAQIDNNVNYNEITLNESTSLFASKLYKALVHKLPGQNILISPVSIQLILGLLQLGAKGKTAQELSQLLALPDNKQSLKEHLYKLQQSFIRYDNETSSKEPNITIVNAIYVNPSVRVSEPFYQDAKKYLNVDVRSLENKISRDSIVKQINDWISFETKQQITHVLKESDVTADTVMLLLNTLHFKGKWRENGFNVLETRNETFYNGVTEVSIPMMRTTDFFLIGRYKALNITYLELPYSGQNIDENGDYVFAIYLPDSLQIGAKLLNDNINYLLLNSPDVQSEEQVDVRIPRFKLNLNAHLKSILEHLGLKHAFSNAELDGLTQDKKSVQVTDVIHNTALDVSEEGTEASAVTVVGIDDRIFSQPLLFVANTPFMFTLKQKSSNIILFIGQYKYA